MRYTTCSFVLALLITTPLVAAPRRRATPPPPATPPCSVVTGTPAVTFSHDEGRTLAYVAERLDGIGYTYGVAVLDTPNTILSWFRNTLSISADAGCSWRPLGDFTFDNPFPPRLAAARGGRAYAWSDNRAFLLRYRNGIPQVVKSPGELVGLGTDPNDGEHLRVASSDGVVWESRDGGDSWSRIATIGISSSQLFYRFAFDPKDLDHIVAGTLVEGAYVTRDGGRNWQQAGGFGAKGQINTFNLVISPVDGNVVWAMALDMSKVDEAPAHGKHIYRSGDGGVTYEPVVDQGPDVTLINGPLLVAHPTDPDVVYFVFGTYFQAYGTDLFRYDWATKTLTNHHNDYDGVNAIDFSPDGRVMYLGLEVVRGHS